MDPISVFPAFVRAQVFPPTGGGGGDIIVDPPIDVELDALDESIEVLIDDESIEVIIDDEEVCFGG